MTQEYDVERIEGRTIKELAQLNTELLEILEYIRNQIEGKFWDTEDLINVVNHAAHEGIRNASLTSS